MSALLGRAPPLSTGPLNSAAHHALVRFIQDLEKNDHLPNTVGMTALIWLLLIEASLFVVQQ